MDKGVALITVILIIAALTILFYFYPLCGFKQIGSYHLADDGCNTCHCTLGGSICNLMGCLNEKQSCEMRAIISCRESNTLPAEWNIGFVNDESPKCSELMECNSCESCNFSGK